MNALEVKNLSMHAGVFGVGELSLSIAEGEYFTLMGHTGSGKSLLLKAICGLAQIDTGRILIRGADVTGLEPRFRNIGYVPQDGGLFPHLDVRRNITFPLTVRGMSLDQAAAETAEAVETLGLTPLLDRETNGLSGGERQKVALPVRWLVARGYSFSTSLSARSTNRPATKSVRSFVAYRKNSTSLRCMFATAAPKPSRSQIASA